ncbi:uncharacterized protein BXZ73DRAFT_101586 [Epithele typhae]|uniref:uncharacterized protein n=1 Tax=Epithele typhae TaxID=378194 RepID=UPI0020086961|nr:uncharacterized protein BXZ73DRAFT_101586 [Epithele typhae]KAH9931673.1 hypothetical protein BXZ73DRAFT_101586 [Epithele typhae]
MLGGSADKIYVVIGDFAHNGGSGLEFINGFTFLQWFYSKYDTANSRIRLAPTVFTKEETN